MHDFVDFKTDMSTQIKKNALSAVKCFYGFKKHQKSKLILVVDVQDT
jgi:hypothetical protein